MRNDHHLTARKAQCKSSLVGQWAATRRPFSNSTQMHQKDGRARLFLFKSSIVANIFARHFLISSIYRTVFSLITYLSVPNFSIKMVPRPAKKSSPKKKSPAKKKAPAKKATVTTEATPSSPVPAGSPSSPKGSPPKSPKATKARVTKGKE